jgi:hypothetical protein
MKRITLITLVAIGTASLAASPYNFRIPTKRDTQLAQLAADWVFHDDWHAPSPTNAYSTRWLQRIPEKRPALLAKHKTIPVNVKSGTNTFALFVYHVAERNLGPRSERPSPWPRPRLIVYERPERDGEPHLIIRWSGGLEYNLTMDEGTNGPSIVSVNDLRYLD